MKKRITYYICCGLLVLCCTGCGEDKTGNVIKETYDVMAGWKDLSDPRGLEPEVVAATQEVKPQIVETRYETEDVVVADIIPTTMGYAVDATGQTDSTDGIQMALYDCFNAGGGTVYLPAGNYAITDTIYIPPYVTLRGDWQDPDEGNEYGTVISIWTDPSEASNTGAFVMSGSSGVIGLTCYYPFQTLYEVLPYPYTFYVPSELVVTIQNVTVINGYKGIGTQYDLNHECLIVDNFKGTFLNCGLALYNQSDVGRVNRVTVSSKYWAEAKSEYMNAPLPEAIDEYMQKNTAGLVLGDLEWTTFSNVLVEGCKEGITVVEGFRIKAAVSMIDVDIKNCSTGILIKDMDDRWGSLVARSSIDGKIMNATSAILRTTDVAHDGKVTEMIPGSIEFEEADLEKYDVRYEDSCAKPKNNLLVADLKKGAEEDVSASLQKFLDDMGSLGGGVVYVPGGVYRLDKPVSVPAGVELRGASAVANREQLSDCMGTLFLCYYGDDASCNADTDAALITLAGENAGLKGIRIIYPENGPYDSDLNTTYTVRGTASGVYVVNCFIMASAYGVDFRNCDNHYIDGVYSCCWYNTFRLGGKNGTIKNSLHNGNMVLRTKAKGLPENWPVEGVTPDVINPIIRTKAQYLILDGSSNEVVNGVFAYGVHDFLMNRNAENTLAVNVGTDNIGDDGAQFTQESGSMTVINAMRYNGHSYDCLGGSVSFYNRIGIRETKEKNEVIAE